MKIINKDFRHGLVKIKVENLDDLWYLSNIIDKGDLVKGITIRKIKLGGEDDRKANIVIKKVFLKVAVEKIEFHKYADVLRVNGTIVDGPDDVTRGSYHTINVEPNTEIEIEKVKWPKYQIDKLEEATKQDNNNILVVAFDREEAFFFKITRQGQETLTNIKGDVAKKDYDQQSKNFYSEILKVVKEYDEQGNYANIIMASPAFYNDELQKNIEDEGLRKKISMATCSGAQKNAINEIMQRPELASVVKKQSISKETIYVEELLTNIAKDVKSVYSFKETKNAADMGAIEKLLVSETLIHKYRESDTFEKLEKVMKTADDSGAEVHIISGDHDAGQKLDGLGGIGAILRYQI